MQFETTKTYTNLAKSFAGESQAGMRYQLIAKLANEEKLITLSDTIRSIAKNETYHAKRFFEMIQEHCENCNNDNIDISTGYPFHFGTLNEALTYAASDENSEFTNIYPTYAKIAEEEGFKDIASLFTMVANVERQHNKIFEYLAQNVKNNTLYKCKTPTYWICSECGYTHFGNEAWKICPLCKAEQGYVQLHLPENK